MKRAVFAKCGDFRFVVDLSMPLMVRAEQKCQPPHEDRSFWHAAGAVLISDMQTAAEHGLQVRWIQRRESCWRGAPHGIVMGGSLVAQLLVLLDATLEAGKAPRRPRDIGTPPAPPPAHGPDGGSGATETGGA